MKKQNILYLIILSFVITSTITAHDIIPGAKQSQPIALVGGTIHPIDSDSIDDGIILFENGIISSVGTDVDLPDNCKEIDISGKHVYPGFIAANTTLGLVEINAVRATRDTHETTSIKPNIRSEVSFNPDSELIPVARVSGVAMAQVVPQGGRIPGRSALMLLDGWTWEDMTLKSSVGMHIQWPSMNINREEEQESKENRDRNLEELNEIFSQARAYWKAQEAQEQNDLPYHETDVRWHEMKPILDGDVPVFIHANGIREIQAAISFAKEQELKMVLVNSRDAWRAADQLVKNNIPVVLETSHTLAMRQWEPYNTVFTHAKKLHEAGIQFCFAYNGMPGSVNNFPYQVASSVAYGLPRETALKAITQDAAKIFGVDDQVGSLAEGKDATLFVSDGDPLDIRTQVEAMYIQGREVDLNSKHKQLYNKYKTKYEQINE